MGKAVSSVGISPNILTTAGFLFSILSGLLFAFRPSDSYFGAWALLAAGLMDILDGSVARASNRVSKAGAFVDSSLDRISEVAVYSGIAFGGEASGFSVVLALGLSMGVSYLRAKGESLNIKVSGIGIGERAERLLVLIIFAFAGYVWIGIYIIIIIAFVTFVHRFLLIVGTIKRPA